MYPAALHQELDLLALKPRWSHRLIRPLAEKYGVPAKSLRVMLCLRRKEVDARRDVNNRHRLIGEILVKIELPEFAFLGDNYTVADLVEDLERLR